tara:strand:- start:2214 stop:2315 length:102 start_codon:yes stop_codon:yes gene_type:complete
MKKVNTGRGRSWVGDETPAFFYTSEESYSEYLI